MTKRSYEILQEIGEFSFNFRNRPEHIYDYVDFHGVSQDKCLDILSQRLLDTQQALDSDKIEANYKKNGQDHVYQVIAGAGKHSVDGVAKLKFVIMDWLDKN